MSPHGEKKAIFSWQALETVMSDGATARTNAGRHFDQEPIFLASGFRDRALPTPARAKAASCPNVGVDWWVYGDQKLLQFFSFLNISISKM